VIFVIRAIFATERERERERERGLETKRGRRTTWSKKNIVQKRDSVAGLGTAV
jgi:adenylosuccinate synthase